MNYPEAPDTSRVYYLPPPPRPRPYRWLVWQNWVILVLVIALAIAIASGARLVDETSRRLSSQLTATQLQVHAAQSSEAQARSDANRASARADTCRAAMNGIIRSELILIRGLHSISSFYVLLPADLARATGLAEAARADVQTCEGS